MVVRMRGFAAFGMVLALGGCTADEPDAFVQPRLSTTPAAGGGLNVLVFSRTEGFRHGSIDVAVPALQDLGAARGWTVDATEDPSVFALDNLLTYDVVAFVLTTGDVLDATQEQAFEDYMAAGKGYVGVHSATDTEFDWPFYGEMLGGYFNGHPSPQQATIHVVDDTHPSTTHLDAQWMRFDEWYDFDPNPSATVEVLLQLDESTYDGGTMGDDHPIAWTHLFGGGRAFYTGGGHTNESWSEPEFLAHVQGGIEWAAAPPPGVGTSTGAATSDGGGTTSTPDDTSTTGGVPDPTTSAPPDGDGDGDDSAPGVPTGTSSTTTGPTGTDTDEPDDVGKGCACSTTPQRHVWLLAGLALLLLARRQRPTLGA